MQLQVERVLRVAQRLLHLVLFDRLPGRPTGAVPAKATIIAGRFSPDETAALQKYAADDRRPAATALRMIVTDFLRGRGYLQ